MSATSPILLTLAILLSLAGCSRQFAVTVNNRSIYDPRFPEGTRQVADSGLQGCLNLALNQGSIQDVAELTVLACPAAEISDLRGIGQLAGLQFLDLAANRISDLQPLAELSRLRGLSLPDNVITDISPLFAMPGLNAVILTGNPGISCSQLARLEQRLGPNLTRPSSCRN
ncbi:MAG: hypothetical protein R3F41_01660 [Gammaproteobacteria bacterium]|nr:hypothetical protein [Pseudomonadales bacterium]MCP5345994.1 hypothetical protein [Pseudomonadales bacterium]